ncbi:MAG: acetate--CoA ligase family protein, partial [Paracoccaceae bacterium]
PNCYGAINYLSKTALWPFAHGGASHRGQGAAIVTQSGMLSSDITMSQRSLPLTHMISCGNQSVLSLEDFTDYLIDVPGVRAIGLHIEGLRDVAHFADVALRAQARGMPIVALKTGSSQIGSALTVSHTGSLSGADDLYDALFERVGILRVSSPSALVETLKFITVAGLPKGGRVAGFTCSGGGATMLADYGEKIGLDLPAIGADQRPAIAALLPDIATVSNPLDYTTPIWGDAERTGPVFAATMDAVGADMALLVQDYPAAGLDDSKAYYLADAGAFAGAAGTRGLPAAICATLHENMDAETRATLVDQGVAPMQGLVECLDAVKAAARLVEMRDRIAAAPPLPLLGPQDLSRPLRMVDEAAGKALLRQWGLPVPQSRLVPAAGVLTAAAALSYPLVLKMIGPRLAHKSEAGAVALGLKTPADLAQALVKMQADVAAYDPAAVTDSFLVEEMAPRPVAELLIGLRRDAQFGAALTLGAGGVLAELLADSATLLLPATGADIATALNGLKLARLLQGYRGAPAADMAALCQMIEALCARFVAEPDLAEIEINPAFASASGCTILDVLIHRFDPARA